MEQLTAQEAQLILQLMSEPRNFQGTVAEVRQIVDFWDEIRRKLRLMIDPPDSSDAQPAPEPAEVETEQGV